MRKIVLIFLLPIQIVFGQSEISLEDCYGWARENYPNLKQAEIWKEITSLKQENIKTNYLPQVTLNGQITYQSDVTSVNIPIPNFSVPTVSKDQYKAFAEIKQTIWDGGISAINSKLEDAILKNNLSQLEVEIYKLNEQVAQAFFTVIVIEKQSDVIIAQKKVLDEKLKSVESGIRNGVVEKSNSLVIKAEILNLDQNEIQLNSFRNAAFQMLSILTGKTLAENSKLVYNNTENLMVENIFRPELQLFSSQIDQLETQIKLLDKTRNPKVFGFGQAGYGKPGLNMLQNEFDTYYLVGAGISWNAFDWKNTDRKKLMVVFQQEMVQKQEETFIRNLKLLLAQQKEQIGKLEKMLVNDKQMVSLRTDISKVAASKLENGTTTSSDYIQELQAETVAKLSIELHKIQLDEAREKYDLIKGKVISGQSQ